MTLVAYVLLTATGVVLWGLVSSWLPRLGFLANAAALIYVICAVPQWKIDLGLGWTVLGLITVGFGLFAAIGGLIEQRQRAAETSGLPRAQIRN